MNAVEEKKTDHSVKVKKRVAIADGVTSKRVVQPSVEEQQIAEVERTFTDRWEW